MTISVRWGQLFVRALIALAAAGCYWRFGHPMELERLNMIAGVLAGVSGTLLGFLITAVALLTSVMDRTLMVNMKATGHYQRLVKETFHTCFMLLVVLMISVGSLLLNEHAVQCLFIALMFFSVLACLYMIEAGQRFSVVITSLS